MADIGIAKSIHFDGPSSIDFEFFAQRTRNRSQLRLGLLRGDARLEAAENIEHSIRTSTRIGNILVALDPPECDVGIQGLKSLGHHSDYGCRDGLEIEFFAEH